MGMCMIRGPRIPGVEDVEVNSPRSCTTATTSSGTSYCGYGSASSQDLDHIAEAVAHFGEDGAIWQRTIPRGRRCKPLSFAGVIIYDENGNLLTIPQQPQEEDQEDQQEDEIDEYFSPHRTLAQRKKNSGAEN